MSLSLFNAVPAGVIETISGSDNNPLFKRADLGRFLGLVRIKDMFKDVKYMARCDIKQGAVQNSPRQRQNPQDAFVDLDGALEIVVRSKKTKAVELAKWLAHKGVKKVIEEHQKAIEEKNTQLALLNDDLTESEKQVVILEQDNLELQAEVERITSRAVPYLEDEKKNNGIVVIQKNNGDIYPYIAICGQQGYVAQKIQNKLTDYPNGQIIVLAETPNAIVHYNWLRERGCIVANPDRVRHFKLGKNYTHQRLIELQEA